MRVKSATSHRSVVRVVRGSTLLVAVLAFGAAACTEPESHVLEFAPFAEAVLRFEQPDSTPLRAYGPNDLKAESPDVAWIADPGTGAVFRFDPLRADYRQMGVLDEPPAEIEQPAKVAVSRQFGIFTFDVRSSQVHLFSPDGEHLRAFETGFVPARLEITRRPIGLVFGTIDRRDEQSPRLTVIRTDALGSQRDTLLHAGTHGPPAMWEAIASSGELSLDGGESGLWAWAQAVPDTVFEITDSPQARKRVLRPEDRNARGVLVDQERGVLWIVREGEQPDELRYSAYDAIEPGTVDAQRAFLGERSTVGFWPWDAVDGTVMGFTRSTPGRHNVASYDMLVPPALP
ncbi:MAG: hypothetical protein M8857_05740 [marine benthic group bacterium]|nr:hypothetical protein [Gemmatimonadota bacterium]